MPGDLLRFDADVCRAYFNRRAFYLTHGLSDCSAFSLRRLVELAQRLAPEYVEYNDGRLPVGAKPTDVKPTGMSAAETIRRVEEAGAWMVLKRVEQDPEYKRLLDDCLAPLEAEARGLVGRTFDRQAFVFISSPGSVTPLHMDPEHNVLMQLHGTKTVQMWDPDDRAVVKETDLETFHAAFTHRQLPFDERFAVGARVLQLAPGQALHFPVTVPHWVKNGPEVSISFSVTFRSEWSVARERLYRLNRRIRQLGLEPTPVGQNTVVDAAKLYASGALFKLREALR